MNERTIFMEALGKTTTEQRAVFLDEACAGDGALRERVEALLRSHEQAGNFLDEPVPERVAAVRAGHDEEAETLGDPLNPDVADESLHFLMPSDKPDMLGRVAHYDILEVIGRGGMGIVLRGFDKKLHRVVAIKVMAAQLAASVTARKRFTREAQAQAAVSHDHVVTIHAVEEANGLPYLVMHYVDGMSLQERLDKSGPLQLQEILRIGKQTASGMAAAHAQGLVHRDIKPANILLENGVERVKITDFGLARAAAEASLTQSGVVAGTPQYMSPEQAEGKPIDQRTDLFSLGSVLYAMCTGRAPFRGSGTMAVLKRICEQQPTPIRETNPDIPDWLVAIIDKLHAKDPAERFQTAEEVANLLGQHLMHLQHPSIVKQIAGLPSSPKARSQHAPLRRRLAIAAALLLCLFAGLTFTEATGVTNVRATVIRILTPDGTLIVEVNDPRVKVSIEGDGGLVITGAGLEEIRLRPGQYKVHAERDGKKVPLERELVSISMGGREVVKVKMEATQPLVPVKTEKGAFVLLAGAKERNFDTLVDAVGHASDGDTIKIRGNGPFVTESINIKDRALTIRAGEGFRPVIRLSPKGAETVAALLQTDAPLVLEGLELQRLGQKPYDPKQEKSAPCLVRSSGKSLDVANCRFRLGPGPRQICIDTSEWDCTVRNCEFLGPIYSYALTAKIPPSKLHTVDNCLFRSLHALLIVSSDPESGDASIQLTGSTFVSAGTGAIPVVFLLSTNGKLPADVKTIKPIPLEATANIFDAASALLFTHENPLPADDAEMLLRGLLAWQDGRNLYNTGGSSLAWASGAKALPTDPPHGPKDLAEWRKFWGTADADSLDGTIHYQGGDLLAKLTITSDKLTPKDFRLRPDSAGYKAGKDGKDLGADVDLVGPGPAYERWKKTPEYQQWLNDTKQVAKAAAPQAESGAFVVLGGKGVPERKFDTLAEAVQGSSDGDTIEIRGNGPFVSDGVTIGNPLVIRAGAGHIPSITLSQASANSNTPLLSIQAPLVLEGLELRWMSGVTKVFGNRFPFLLDASPGGSLHVANCRLIFKVDPLQGNFGWPFRVQAKSLSVRNSLISGNVDGTSWQYGSGGRCTFENCVSAAGGIGFSDHDPDLADVRIDVRGSTLVGNCLTLATFRTPNLAEAAGAKPPVQLVYTGNVARWDKSTRNKGFLYFHQWHEAPLSLKETEELLPRFIGIEEKDNVYQTGTPMLRLMVQGKRFEGQRNLDLVGWNQFWGQKNTGSLEGDIHFQGGDLVSRARLAPEQLTAEDFRLPPDSAGYQAGKDGKDLGADIDLVGPGPAYERWKKTPEYQQWLRDTGQKK